MSGPSDEDIAAAKVILDFATRPHDFDQTLRALQFLRKVVKYGDANQVGFSLTESKEMIFRLAGLVSYVIHERAL